MTKTATLNEFYRAIVRALEAELKKREPQTSVCAEIKKFGQVKKIYQRKAGKKFGINDHAEAMIMAMLSGQIEWRKIELNLPKLKEVFGNFKAEHLASTDPEVFISGVKECKCGTWSTRRQMRSIAHNIEVLQSIPNYFRQFNHVDDFLGKTPALVAVSILDGKRGSDTKLKQMSTALISEYMRNCGIDMAKPDRHINRLLNEQHLGDFLVNAIGEDDLNESGKVLGPEKNYDGANEHERSVIIISAFAKHVESVMQKGQAATATEVDNVLWMFCANKYGEICTKKYDKCGICPAKTFCPTGRKKPDLP